MMKMINGKCTKDYMTWHHFVLRLVIPLFFLVVTYGESPALENDDCYSCHNEELVEMSSEEREEMVEQSVPFKSEIEVDEYLKSNKPVAQLSLSIDPKRYGDSVHSDIECISCHEDIEEIPHQQHLQVPTACCNCHDEEIAEEVAKSVHGKLSPDKCTTSCIGCHDPHYGQSREVWESDFEVKGCLPCHDLQGGDLIKKHGTIISQPKIHLTQLNCNLSGVGCVICHVSSGKRDPHRIVSAEFALKDCIMCHSANSILLTNSTNSQENLPGLIALTKFTNKELMEGGQYIIGANRIPALDIIGLIIVFGTFALPIVHGGLRFILRKRKGK